MTERVLRASGPDLPALLALLFVGLKLTGYIDWSWWWVLAPIWVPLAILIVCAAGSWAIFWLFFSKEERQRARLASNLRALGRSIR